VPALLVAGDDPRGDLEALADRAAALLRLAQRAAELVAEPRLLGPVMPAEGLEVRPSLAGDVGAVEQAFPRAELDEVLATTSARLFGLPPVLAGPSGEDPAR
jgi:hypothetical protein